MKRPLRLLAVIAAVVLVIALTKSFVAKTVVSAGVKAMTGLTLHMRRLDVGVFTRAVRITDLTLRNPSGFADPNMMSLPEIYVHYDLGSLLRGKVHLQEVRLNLEEFAVIKNASGQLNLDSLTAVQASKEPSKQTKADKGKMPEIQIDVLTLQIGKVVYRDYSRSGPPSVQEFPVNINERYEHVTNPYVLTSLIVSRALVHTTVAKLTGFDLGALEGMVGEQLSRAKDLATAGVSQATSAAKGAVAGATKAGKEAMETAGESLSDATESIKGATDSLKKLNPFKQ